MERPDQMIRNGNPTQGVETTEVAVIPVIAETVSIGQEVRETGRVRVIKTVAEFTENVSLPTYFTEADVQHVPVNRLITGAPPQVEQRGDTIVVPVLEEVVVTEKRLMLREEIHIALRRREESRQETVTLHREVVSIQRDTPSEGEVRSQRTYSTEP